MEKLTKRLNFILIIELQVLTLKIIAFYLPQFHTIPENDIWWGKGFTEWTNTRKAQKLFQEHYQPKEPLNDYYYDLTDANARRWQAEIAKAHGIYGFCYYHYWFKGRRLLERPFNEVLNSGDPDFPFCLSWANEPWTRSWDGKNKEILMGQEYGEKQDWQDHFDYLVTAFKDNRYIKINNKPLFIIYRPSSIVHCNEMLEFWNQLAIQQGFDGMYFVQSYTSFDNTNFRAFQAKLEFEPMFTVRHDLPLNIQIVRYCKKLLRKTFRKIIPNGILLDKLDYDLIWSRIIGRKRHDDGKETFLGAFVDWDNSARKGENALIVTGGSPEKFSKYVEIQIENSKKLNSEFLFINAWNEWAEGTFLEPDKKYGFAYLEQLQRLVKPL
jgi:hypothetical protein